MFELMLVRAKGGVCPDDGEVKLRSVRRLASHHVAVESKGSVRAAVMVHPYYNTIVGTNSMQHLRILSQ